ncbi:MAG: HD domain-containing phosphohydrolase [Thermodesulfobacteriota bacterium]
MTDNAKNLRKPAYSGLSPREQFLADIYSLLRTVKVYQANNKLVIVGVDHFRRSLEKVLGGNDTLDLMIEGAHFYFQDEKLLLRSQAEQIQANLLKYFEQRGLAGLTIKATATEAPITEVVNFAGLLNNSVRQENPMEWLVEQLTAENLLWVTPVKRGEDNEAYEVERQENTPKREATKKRAPRKVYAYTLKSVQEVAKKLASKENTGIRKTVRMVQTMAEEILLNEQPMMMAMSTIKAYDDYTFAHSVNVAILAMYIGKSIGLPKDTIERLGLCGLFHDLGKIVWPHELLNKTTPLDEDDLKLIRQHSLNSTRIIIQQLNSSIQNKGRLLLPPFEHHLKYDLSGYPKLGWKKPLSLCGRIMAIADVYDALTSPRVYRKEAISADLALGMMLEQSGTVFDPILLKVFINMLGVYPLGTLLRLDGGELALVSQRSTSDDISRPWVLLLHPTENGGYSKGTEIDLSEKDSTGSYLRRIEKSMNPVTFNIQPAEFLT